VKRKFRLSAQEIKPLVAEDLGGCFITDRVTVDGLKIGYMYREVPTRPEDSGWRFFSGDESEDYINDLTHTGVYAVNTAANYDPDIIPYLDTLPPCAFEKVGDGPEYESVEDAGLSDSEFPVVEGQYQMTESWAVTLPRQFNKRFEDDSLVLWRPGITIWTVVWNNDNAESQQERLNNIRKDVSPDAFDGAVVADGDVTRFTYRLTEHREEGVVHALYAFAIGVDGHVQMAIYFDNEADLDLARQISDSLTETGAS
jgi:hypothetical protein